jgi:hypothetical protein
MKIYKQKAQEPKYNLGQVLFYMEEGENEIIYKPFVVRNIFINWGGSISYGLMPIIVEVDGNPRVITDRRQRERIQERYLISDETQVVSYMNKVAKRLRDKIMKRTMAIRDTTGLLLKSTEFEELIVDEEE